MALKNTYSKSPVENSLKEIEKALVQAGAIGISRGYENGRITSLIFGIKLKDQTINFKLPVNWKKVQQVLKNEGFARSEDDDASYRISWAILRDWVTAQMAILATETVELPQLFLPYAMSGDGKTLYDKVMSSGLLLSDGK